MKRSALFVASLSALLIALPASAAGKYGTEPVRPFVLYVFAPDPDNKPAIAEYDMLQKAAGDVQGANVMTVYVVGDGKVKLPPPDAHTDDASNVRKRYHVDANAFRVVLVGENGFEKMRWSEPVDAHQIIAHTNEMPRSKDSSTQ